jgi:hypothetical protein
MSWKSWFPKKSLGGHGVLPTWGSQFCMNWTIARVWQLLIAWHYHPPPPPLPPGYIQAQEGGVFRTAHLTFGSRTQNGTDVRGSPQAGFCSSKYETSQNHQKISAGGPIGRLVALSGNSRTFRSTYFQGAANYRWVAMASVPQTKKTTCPPARCFCIWPLEAALRRHVHRS